jgi:hypothetical protein
MALHDATALTRCQSLFMMVVPYGHQSVLHFITRKARRCEIT